ncbi:MAG: ABC transporter substrate-binding protein [Candidatus Phytoplasma stylosanthis]|uniref:ABC transporter substrate-binding protein n=1 Tax=Candidatus Phytoplasma stylosanthis TaxID=2798314 RepID=UPI0029396499|nr:ABC transporter substrate-binding protein [Candidatus Phytoplasma stylosanthis]MDV3167761.1 ABC transporter substrate-binding protein [Candidatus Phytoplasma stylosanthis]MDV3170962.1 ABC transporter substrate-binding protein [Candidatus Phytoplasma stylosanthis]MDV3173639.1 ABC transporter substrate-binding protein [Candidatus Phytoplasma stylosanthis]MDV3174134.1 ABC transporter substrate-binding protein [Candidatus Phytoplasma stylosanthis]
MFKIKQIKDFFIFHKKKMLFSLLIIGFIISIIVVMNIFKKKNYYVIAISSDIKGFDVSTKSHTNSVYSNFVFKFMHDTLLKKDDNGGEVKPLLLEKFEKDDNDKHLLKCKLRDDIYFHNNEKMTSDDVIFTIERGKKNKYDKFEEIKSYKKIDEHIFHITLQKPHNQLGWDYFFYEVFRVLNKKAVEENENEGVKIGSGKYRLVEYNEGDSIIIKLFDRYFNKDEEDLKDIKLVICDNANTILQELESGNYHIAPFFQTEKIRQLENDIKNGKYKNIKIQSFPVACSNYIYFNKDKTKREVRKIIQQGLDINKIILDLELSSFFNVAKTCINSNIMGHDKNIDYHNDVNFEKAKELCSQLTNEERKINIACASGRINSFVNKIIEQLKKIGFEISINEIEFNSYIQESIKKDSKYNFIFMGESFDIEFGHKYFQDYFMTNNNQNNFCHIDGDEDKINIEDKINYIQQIKNSNPEKYKNEYEKKMFEIEKYIYDQAYVLPLTEIKSYVLINSKIKSGFEPDKFGHFNNINSIRIRKVE